MSEATHIKKSHHYDYVNMSQTKTLGIPTWVRERTHGLHPYPKNLQAQGNVKSERNSLPWEEDTNLFSNSKESVLKTYI